MGLFNLKSGSEMNKFAKELASDLANRYPPELESNPQSKISANKVGSILESVLNKVTDYKKHNKLGIYKKAKLGNAFKWELQEAGYSEKFIDVATEGLIVYITKK